MTHRALAATLLSATILIALETTALLTALPTISDELRGDGLYGATLAAYTLATMTGLVVAGFAADGFGPRRPFVVCVSLFVIGLVISSLAPTMTFVLIGRTVQGLGGGGLTPISYAVISRMWPGDQQSRLFAALSVGWVLPSLLAPALAGWVTQHWGWRWVFVGIIPAAVTVGILGSTTIPNLTSTAPTGRDQTLITPAVLLSTGLGAVIIGLQHDRWWIAAPLVASGAAVAARGFNRIMPTSTHRASPGLPAILVCRILAMAAFLGVDSFIPLAADRVHGSSPTEQGFVIIGAALTWSLGSVIVGRRREYDVSRLVRAGFVLILVGILAIVPTLRASWPLSATFIGWSIAGFGMGLLYVPTSVLAMTYADRGQEGATGSRINLSDSIGFALMGGVGGATVAVAERTSWSLTQALATNFAVAALLAIVGITLAGRTAATRSGAPS